MTSLARFFCTVFSLTFGILYSQDLKISYASSSSNVIRGQNVAISFTESNTGTVDIGSHEVGFYLSVDQLISSGDVYLGSKSIASIAKGGYSSAYIDNLSIPFNTLPGTYYVLTIADDKNTIVELDELNNTYASTTKVQELAQNLKIEQLSLPSTNLTTNSDVTVKVWIRSTDGIAQSTLMGIYLSSDSLLSSDDKILDNYNIPLDSYSGTRIYDRTITIPSTPYGKYYLISKVDNNDAIPELYENDNTQSIAIHILSPSIDLKVIELSLSSNQSVRDGRLSFNTKIKNIGATPAISVFHGLFLSKDSIYSSNDVALYKPVYGNRYYSGDSLSISSSFNIPATTSLGSYYVLSVVDYANTIVDVNRANNTKASKINIVASTIDLEIKSLTLSTQAFQPSKWVKLQLTETNKGTAECPSHNIAYYISKDPVLSSDDLLLNSYNVSPVPSNDEILEEHYINIPLTYSSGTYYLIAKTNYDDAVIETNKANNTKAISFTLLPIQRDVAIVSHALLPSSLYAGNWYDTQTMIANLGEASESVGVSYALSKDSIFSSDDILLSSGWYQRYPQDNSSLQPSQTDSVKSSVLIPKETIAGQYYFIRIVDVAQLIPESNESNNSKASLVTVNAYAIDLIVSSLSTTDTMFVPSKEISVSLTVNNIGGSTLTVPYMFSAYLSKDPYFDASDVLLKSSTFNGGTNRDQFSTSFAATDAGIYYIIGIMDPENKIAERNETNNVKVLKITVIPRKQDLKLQSITELPISVITGQRVAVETRELNLGNVPIQMQHNVSFYLSKDSTFDNNDILLGERVSNGIGLGSYTTISPILTIPNTTTPGNYYIVAIADQSNLVAEDNETNNKVSLPITVLPQGIDLKLLSHAVTMGSFIQGVNTFVSLEVSNSGTTASQSTSVVAYLSTDAVLSANDTRLSSEYLGSLQANEKSKVSFNIMPRDTIAGIYYIIFKADPDQSVLETNESNNTYVLKTNILKATRDLEIVSLGSTVSRLACGDSTAITAFQRNSGTIDIPFSQHIAFYLSKDSVYDANDIYLNKKEMTNMLPSAYASASLWITIPEMNTFGAYYIIARADDANVVLESNESNNTRAFAITIHAPNRDLVIERFSVPTYPIIIGYGTEITTAQGSYISPTVSVACKGTDGSPAHRMAFYLSADSILQASDTYLTSTAIKALNSGQSITINPQIYIGTQVAVGNYYILAVEDYDNSLKEVNENNNIKFIKAQVKAPFIDLLFDNYFNPTTSKKLEPNTKLITGDVLNLGFTEYNRGNMASGYHYIAYYLSTDSIYQASDTYLGNTYASPITMQSVPYASIYTTLSPPALQNDVEYYIIVVLDYDSKVLESDENNNIAYLKIKKITPQVDLFVDELKLNTVTPLIEATNSSVSFNIKESNKGITEAATHKIGLYLSSDSIFQDSDQLVASQSISNIWPNSYTQTTLSFGLSTAIKAGDYYVFAVADYEKTIAETDENNISKPIKISIIPQTRDLVATQLLVRQKQVEIGKYINIKYNLKNQGSMALDASNVGVYLSTDSVFSANDKLIATKATPVMAAGAVVIDSTAYAIPTNTALGYYYVILVGDYLNKVIEAVETNNSKYVPLEIIYYAVDLTISTLAPLTDARQNTQMSLKLDLKNLGKMPLGTCYVFYFISKDTIRDASDTQLAYFNINDVGSESSLETTHTFNIGNIAVGNYYLIASLDHENYIKEFNEDNNKKIIPITVLPDDKDFEMMDAKMQVLSTFPNKMLYADVKIKNNSVTRRNVRTICYLSQDSLYDTQDLEIGSFYAEIIGKSTLDFNMSFTVPPTATAGVQYLIFAVDGTNAFFEVNENNNRKALKITVLDSYIDLKVNTLSVPKTVISRGAVLSGNFQVENLGTLDLYDTEAYLCLSADSIYSPEDVKLSTITFYAPTIGSLRTQSFTTTLAKTLPLGNQYLIIVIDPLNKTKEDNISNQSKALKVEIVPEFVDLKARSSYSVSTVYGQLPSISIGVVNDWMLPVASHSIKTFLSKDSIYDASDLLWSTQTISPTSADGTYYVKLDTQQPNVGNYYVLVLLDDKNEIQEINEANNIVVIKLQVLPQYYDLSVSLEASNSYTKAVPGKPMYFTTSIINKGSVAYTNYTAVNIFLSKDQNFSKDDISIVGGLIPANTALGQYYALAIVDLAMSIPEIDETNNVAVLPLQVYPPCVDIYFTSLTVSNTYWAAGSKMSFKHKQLNKGSLDATAFNFDYYLSTDSTLSNDDLKMQTLQMSGINLSVQSSTFEASIVVPENLTYGDYYFIVKANKPTAIDECDESNNTKSVKVQISGPYVDLLPTQVSIPSTTVSAGSSFNVSIAMSNKGNLYVDAQQIAVYISKDSTIGSAAQLLTVRSYAGFKKDSTVNASVNIHNYLQNGTYYLLVDLDYGKAIAETNENNNLAKVKITVSTVTNDLDWEHANDINLYPNPSNGLVQLRYSNTVPPIKMEMYDLQQRLVFETDELDKEINISTLPTGVYIVKISDVKGYIYTEKLVVIE